MATSVRWGVAITLALALVGATGATSASPGVAAAGARAGYAAPDAQVEAARLARICTENKRPTSGFPAVGAVLRRADSGKWAGICTATLVGCSTVLTAAHCFYDDKPDHFVPDPARLSVYFQHAGFFQVERISPRHPKYRPRCPDPPECPDADLTVLHLATPVHGVPASPLNADHVFAPFDAGTIVGFGRRNVIAGCPDDAGVKRAGPIRLAPCEPQSEDWPDTLLCWNYTRGSANACPGDSGGPTYMVGTGDPPTGRLAGVHIYGRQEDCGVGDHTWDLDVRRYAAWVGEQAAGDLGSTQCGTRAPVGTAGAQVVTESATMGPGQASTLTVDVPAGVAGMVVTLNGEDRAGRADWELVVRGQGCAEDCDTPHCVVERRGPFSVCGVDAPAAGTWRMQVSQSGTDGGEYQLTVTLFAAPD